jgi:hypothetical protein
VDVRLSCSSTSTNENQMAPYLIGSEAVEGRQHRHGPPPEHVTKVNPSRRKR